MTKPTSLDITNKTAFEQSVYAEFPTSLHEHVEHDLFYHSEDLFEGKMTMLEFKADVLKTARWHEESEAQLQADKVTFEGVRSLLAEGVFENGQHAAELAQEIEQGEGSLLARFIWAQPVRDPFDAAVSFLAWKHTKALVELEAAFDINLDKFRDANEPDFFCTSESNMSLINFSVMSQ